MKKTKPYIGILWAVLLSACAPSVGELNQKKEDLCRQVRAVCRATLARDRSSLTDTRQYDDCKASKEFCDSQVNVSGENVRSELGQIINNVEATLSAYSRDSSNH